MLDSARIIYKGDMIAALFYMSIGLFMALVAILLQYFNISLGFLYLSYGLWVFSLYCIGKGLAMMYIYRKRFFFYESMNEITPSLKSEELLYTENRIKRKQNGRRMHVYIMIIGSIVAFAGIFAKEKGLIIGTCIPLVLLSGIEFSAGLLTEFRLHEYFRILKKD